MLYGYASQDTQNSQFTQLPFLEASIILSAFLVLGHCRVICWVWTSQFCLPAETLLTQEELEAFTVKPSEEDTLGADSLFASQFLSQAGHFSEGNTVLEPPYYELI